MCYLWMLLCIKNHQKLAVTLGMYRVNQKKSKPVLHFRVSLNYDVVIYIESELFRITFLTIIVIFVLYMLCCSTDKDCMCCCMH